VQQHRPDFVDMIPASRLLITKRPMSLSGRLCTSRFFAFGPHRRCPLRQDLEPRNFSEEVRFVYTVKKPVTFMNTVNQFLIEGFTVENL
jgi:hypothetical protein